MAESESGLEPLPLFDRLRWALAEDHGPGEAGDVTSNVLVPPGRTARAKLLIKAEGVVCGVNVLPLIFQLADEWVRPEAQDLADELRAAGDLARGGGGSWATVERLQDRTQREGVRVKTLLKDGAVARRGEVAAEIEGSARALLFGERTALNLFCRLSGIATRTARFVELCKGTKAKIVDTRKTTPLWRDLEKYAVACGGGVNHRRGLYDMVLIKDNHLALWGAHDPSEAVRAAKARYPALPVMIEVADLAGLAKVCRGGAPAFVLLDNFDVDGLAQAVRWCEQFYQTRPGRPLLEASGGVSEATVAAIAATGVDRISVGGLTHSVSSLDASLEIS